MSNTPKGVRFTLARKGVLFVFVMLMVELLLLGSLSVLLAQSEEELWKESHANALLSECDDLIRLFYDAGSSLVAFAATRDELAAARFRHTVETIPAQVETLHTLNLVGRQPDPAITKIEEMAEKSVALLNRTNKVVEQSSKVEFLVPDEGRREVKEQLAQLVTALGEFADTQRKRKKELSGRVAQTRLRVKQSIAVTAGMNVLLAIVAVAWLMQTISKRLDNIVSNTHRLKTREPLNPALPGTDEIAHLDRVFHEMADGLEETARLKEEFLAVISHEIRSPVSSITMLLEMMTAGSFGTLNEWEQQRVKGAEHSAKRVIDLINSLLEIQKYDQGLMELNIKSCLIKPVIEHATRTVFTLAERKNIKVLHQEVSGEFFADPLRIEQVLINLIANAIKYSPEGTTINVIVEKQDEFIEFGVQDNGPGIPLETQGDLFGKFQQVGTNYDQNSSGLGLYICKSIVEGHQGEIGVQSEPGKGCLFWFKIPR